MLFKPLENGNSKCLEILTFNYTQIGFVTISTEAQYTWYTLSFWIASFIVLNLLFVLEEWLGLRLDGVCNEMHLWQENAGDHESLSPPNLRRSPPSSTRCNARYHWQSVTWVFPESLTLHTTYYAYCITHPPFRCHRSVLT